MFTNVVTPWVIQFLPCLGHSKMLCVSVLVYLAVIRNWFINLIWFNICSYLSTLSQVCSNIRLHNVYLIGISLSNSVTRSGLFISVWCQTHQGIQSSLCWVLSISLGSFVKTFIMQSFNNWQYGCLCNGTQYNIMWLSFSLTCNMWVVFSGSTGFLHHNITEILLKVVLNTINLNQTYVVMKDQSSTGVIRIDY